MKRRIPLFALLLAASASGADFGVRVIPGLTDKVETKWDGSANARGEQQDGEIVWASPMWVTWRR